MIAGEEKTSIRGAEPAPTRRARPELAGLFGLTLLSGVWAWWAWQEGAYFGVVLLPGAIVLCGCLVILARAGSWRGSLRLGHPAALALLALIGLAVWSTLSALWSPAPDVAITDGQRILVYALSFGLGIWVCNLLGSRIGLCLVPLAVAGAVAGIATIIALTTGGDPRDYLAEEGTLDYPLGYRNANAAFFLIALFPALGLAADRELDWRARGAALGAGTLCIDLALLSQSRGSMWATAVALTVYGLASPLRLRALSWLVLAAVPALGILPTLNDLYRAANDEGLSASLSELHAAGIATAVTAAVSLAIGAFAARSERRLPGLGNRSPDSNRTVALALGGLAAAAGIAFVIAVGDPVDWVGQRAKEFQSESPDLSAESSRFTLNTSSERYDFWRVALDDAGEDPLLGDGGGGYQYTYLRKRETSLTPHDAHSVELEVLSELGVPGLTLLLVALGGATLGVVRARRVSQSASAVSAIALAAGAYWLAHSSIDWFWPYPAITAPVMALLGSACAPGLQAPHPHPPGRGRRWLIAGAAVLALSAVPFFLSERYVNRAYDEWRSDLPRAYDDLDRARALNPFSHAPMLAEGAIADAAGDRARAISAFREAASERPEEWAAHYLLAELYAKEQPALAREELEIARDLNPSSPDVRSLGRALGVRPEAEPG